MKGMCFESNPITQIVRFEHEEHLSQTKKNRHLRAHLQIVKLHFCDILLSRLWNHVVSITLFAIPPLSVNRLSFFERTTVPDHGICFVAVHATTTWTWTFSVDLFIYFGRNALTKNRHHQADAVPVSEDLFLPSSGSCGLCCLNGNFAAFQDRIDLRGVVYVTDERITGNVPINSKSNGSSSCDMSLALFLSGIKGADLCLNGFVH